MRLSHLFPIFIFLAFSSCDKDIKPDIATPVAPEMTFPHRLDSFTIQGEKRYVDGYETLPINDLPEYVNVVVEIPTGSVEKWEVDKASGLLKWEMVDGKPRVVKYLGYPGNYGMIPGTLLPKEKGGDGDPLDVIVLGPPEERGAVIQAWVVGVLKLQDRGEQDDKLIAVKGHTQFDGIRELADLQAKFPGVLEIVETWFSNYKGPGKSDRDRIKSLGYGDKQEAIQILKSTGYDKLHNLDSIIKASE
jgi:inorganic pyrophosphatase